jgi:hypothetical protein
MPTRRVTPDGRRCRNGSRPRLSCGTWRPDASRGHAWGLAGDLGTR